MANSNQISSGRVFTTYRREDGRWIKEEKIIENYERITDAKRRIR